MVPQMAIAAPNPKSEDLVRQVPLFFLKSGVRIFPAFG